MRHHNSVFHRCAEAGAVGGLRPAGGGARGGSAGSAAEHQEPVCRPAVRPAGGGREPARDRGGTGEPRSAGSTTSAAAPARRSTLADANALRPCAVFAELFAAMMARRPIAAAPQAGRNHLSDRFDRPAARRPQRRLGALLGQGVRRQAARRLRSRCRPADLCRGHRRPRVNDITAAQAMPIEPGATYVFDLGYYDYAWWAAARRAQAAASSRASSATRRWR